ncbi:MAG TPA: HAD-IB family phosphatase [Solirubrobacteraceae bacterium]|jgi:phosphoserine phosphatase
MAETVECGFPVVVFDLDGTLLHRTSVSLLLAEWLGRGEQMLELERSFHAGEISNSVVADAQASWFAGRTKACVWEVLARGPWISGMRQTLETLREGGTEILLGTVTWSFAAEMLRERHGFAAISGTEMQADDGVLSGRVSRYFDEHDKLSFVKDWCEAHGHSIGEVAAIGDSRSDVPLFGRVGRAIALNATPDARAAATHCLDTDDLRDALALLGPDC